MVISVLTYALRPNLVPSSTLDQMNMPSTYLSSKLSPTLDAAKMENICAIMSLLPSFGDSSMASTRLWLEELTSTTNNVAINTTQLPSKAACLEVSVVSQLEELTMKEGGDGGGEKGFGGLL